MALIYQTTMSPTKYELIASWLPAQPWFTGEVSELSPVGAYRFDDPEGEVGMEGHLFTAGDSKIYHVPLTYRGAALTDAEPFLLGTSQHGVFGTRWITDATGDPVFRAALAAAIVHGQTGAEEIIDDLQGNRWEQAPSVRVRGSGTQTGEAPTLQDATVDLVDELSRIEDDYAVLDVVRVIEPERVAREDQLVLRATWEGQTSAAILALLYAG